MVSSRIGPSASLSQVDEFLLIEFADELASDLAGDEVEALGNILSARRSGFHLLTARDEVFARLGNSADLADRERGILAKSRGRQFQKAELLKSISVKLLVTRDTGPALERDGDRETVIVPLRHFARYSAADRSVVLGEGEADAGLAVRMARHFAHTRELDGVPLRPREAAGGGRGTSGTFRRYREDPRLCLCIVDSDRVAPGHGEGDTAVAVLDEVDEAKPWAAVQVIACREMENTLSLGLMVAAFGDDRQYRRKLRNLEQFEDGATLGRYREYCDFKRGTRLKWVFEELKEEESRRFWLGPEAPAVRAPSVKRKCVAEGACPREKDCACEIAPGLGGALLATCVEVAREMSDRELERLLCAKTRPHWQSVGRTVFSWTCGTEATRV